MDSTIVKSSLTIPLSLSSCIHTHTHPLTCPAPTTKVCVSRVITGACFFLPMWGTSSQPSSLKTVVGTGPGSLPLISSSPHRVCFLCPCLNCHTILPYSFALGPSAVASPHAWVKVCYVDYGNQEQLPLTHLRPLEPQFCQLPCQALHCSLTGVHPVPHLLSSDRTVPLSEVHC